MIMTKGPPPSAFCRLPSAYCRLSLRGQSIIETAVLLSLAAAALLVFFSFVRNAVSSRLKSGADTFGHGLLHNGN